MKKYYFVVIVLLSAVILSGCSNEAEAIKQRKQDAQIAGIIYKRNLPLVENQEVIRYINKIGQKLLAQPMATQKKLSLPISFYVMNLADPDVSSFTSGGYIFLHRDNVTQAPSEGLIAGILSHEIAHNYLGHEIVSVSDSEDCRLESLKCLKEYYAFGRSEELEADDLGVRMMVSAGYDPEDLAQYFLKRAKEMKKNDETSYPTHPSMYERVKKIRALAKTLHVSKNPIKNTDDLKRSKQLLKRIKAKGP